MEKYLPRSVREGDKLRLAPANGEVPMTGVVVRIPDHRRYAVARFDVQF